MTKLPISKFRRGDIVLIEANLNRWRVTIDEDGKRTPVSLAGAPSGLPWDDWSCGFKMLAMSKLVAAPRADDLPEFEEGESF